MNWIYLIDLFGTLVFAISGVTTAIQKKFDLVGTLVIGFVTAIGGFIVPLILWLTKKDEILDMDKHGKSILNFRITMFIYFLLCIPAILFFGLGLLGLAGVSRRKK